MDEDETSAVLAAVKARGELTGNMPITGVRLARGHLVPFSNAADGATPPGSLIGAVLRGTDSNGKAVEVAICTAEPAADDPDMTWYRIQVWNELTDTWQNPCLGTKRVPNPRVLAVQGTWDATGAHRDSEDEFTFACETGVIAKCARWGYKPWEERNGQSLATLHQACTRMARADYCGDGRSHTREDTAIDIYDALNVLSRATEATSEWNPERASFEATWGPDGAVCLARTRNGRALDEILNECPGRFQKGRDVDMGDGDRCSVQRDVTRADKPLMRNRSYTPSTANAGAGSP